MVDTKLFLGDGSIFGADENGIQRLNIACPRSILEDAMERMKRRLFFNVYRVA